ncbi:peroxidase 60 [Citrus sinensis]|uniref:peroxidase 60 n=1 Tax=Citrus sinensis TaxID=2711 RepID=UPI0003D71FE8|nr:peroxidase 60 [Citrus sinensis]
MMSSSAALVLALGLILVNFTGHCHGALQVGFYRGKCRLLVDVESVVATVVKAKLIMDPTITPALLRMQFHDCFVNGCDASILLDGRASEKTAPPNLSVRGYDVIDAAKAALESICPGVVSCADIIAMATRDAVSLSGGGRYNVETGRKDGFVSLATNVNLPGPDIPVAQSVATFAKKGLNATDMVYLLGGHTVGIAHCSFFQDRLYNYKNTGKPDPNMDPSLLVSLRRICPMNSARDNTVNLDQDPASSLRVDNSFYKQIMMRRGILQIDQDLATNSLTKATVAKIATGDDFNAKFGEAMVKMGRVQVLTGNQGEIRKSCRAVNKR